MEYEKTIKVTLYNEIKEFKFIEKYDDLIKKIKEIFNIPNTTKIILYNIDFDNDKLTVENQKDYELCDADYLGNLLFEIEIKSENTQLNKEEEKDNNIIYDNKELQDISFKKEKDKTSLNDKEKGTTISYTNNFESDNLFENKSELNNIHNLNLNQNNISFNDFANSLIDFNNMGNEELIQEFQNQCDEQFQSMENKFKEYIDLKINEIYSNIDKNIDIIMNSISKNKNSFSTTTDNSEKNFIVKKQNNEFFSILNKSEINKSNPLNNISYISNNNTNTNTNTKHFQCEIILPKKNYEFKQNQLENKFINIEIKNKGAHFLPNKSYITSENNTFIIIYQEINQYIKPNETIKINCKICFKETKENISIKLKIGHKNNNYIFEHNYPSLFIKIVKPVKNKVQKNGNKFHKSLKIDNELDSKK